MENEPEVIRKEMQDTRTSLTEKLEALSQQVTGTVHDARAAMLDTVDTFRGVVTETVSTVKEQVTGTVDTVKQQFTGTVDSMKEQVAGTVDSVKETFDLEHHVVNHPLAMVGGAVALGYLGGVMLNRLGGPATYRRALPMPAEPQRPSHASNAFTPPPATLAATAPPRSLEAMLPGFLQSFEPEIKQLKSVAIGAVFGILRDLVQQRLPPNLNEPVTRVVNDLTTKMGGTPVQGHLLDPDAAN